MRDSVFRVKIRGSVEKEDYNTLLRFVKYTYRTTVKVTDQKPTCCMNLTLDCTSVCTLSGDFVCILYKHYVPLYLLV